MPPPALMPALFIGHGSPMNAIEDSEFSEAWAQAAGRFPKPKAVLCVSAHWETDGLLLNAVARPRTIHDFYGFPEELYAVRYPAPGAPELAEKILEALTGFSARPDNEWGLDHGAWSVLRRMYPQAGVPVLQLSLDSAQDVDFHYRIGRELGKLREQGVLVLGSGNIVHNLRLYNFYDDSPYPWATAFDGEIRRLVQAGQHQALAGYRALPGANMAIPTPEHYLPLLYVLGASRSGEQAELFCRKVLGSISMTCVAFGLN